MSSNALFKLVDGGIEVEECPERIRECTLVKKLGPHPVLVLYLAYTGRARIVDADGNELSIEDAVKSLGDKSLWITFSTFLDLRRRGKIPEPGSSPNELVIDSEGMCVYVYEENAIVTPEELVSITESSMRRECRAVIAVVDMYGDVTYYEVSKMSFPKIERR